MENSNLTLVTLSNSQKKSTTKLFTKKNCTSNNNLGGHPLFLVGTHPLTLTEIPKKNTQHPPQSLGTLVDHVGSKMLHLPLLGMDFFVSVAVWLFFFLSKRFSHMSMLGSWAPTSQESFLYQQDLFELRIFSDVFFRCSDFYPPLAHHLCCSASKKYRNPTPFDST